MIVCLTSNFPAIRAAFGWKIRLFVYSLFGESLEAILLLLRSNLFRMKGHLNYPTRRKISHECNKYVANVLVSCTEYTFCEWTCSKTPTIRTFSCHGWLKSYWPELAFDWNDYFQFDSYNNSFTGLCSTKLTTPE